MTAAVIFALEFALALALDLALAFRVGVAVGVSVGFGVGFDGGCCDNRSGRGSTSLLMGRDNGQHTHKHVTYNRYQSH